MTIENQDADNRTETFLSNLRRETLPAHEQLEQLPLSLSIVSKDVTLEEYTLYLKLMYQIIDDAEQSIFPGINDIIPYFNNRRKAYLIENDLIFLGRKNTGISNFPFKSAGYNFTAASASGILYVIEGSALGGRIIFKNIKKSLGLTEENGCSYFAGYKEETGALWKSFLSQLTAFETKNNCGSEIITGANFAFTVIYNYLQKNSNLIYEHQRHCKS